MKNIYFFREKGREKERERNIDVRENRQLAASCVPPNGGLAHNPGMCPDRESNQQPLGSQAGTQSTEPPTPVRAPVPFSNTLFFKVQKQVELNNMLLRYSCISSKTKEAKE